MNTLNQKFLSALNDFSLIGDAKSVLVALSGGKDSAVLLCLLCDYAKKSGIKLFAAHFNHMIRASEAERDEQFSKELAQSLCVPFFSGRGNVPAFSKENSLSLEEAARVMRYDFLEKCRLENNIDLIATAHTLSDNTETVLFNITRGTGVKGLAGIPPKRGRIIRPLIYASTEDILAYAAEKGIDYITDSTNSDTAYSRNFLRHEIIPLMKTKFPAFEEMCMRLSKNAAKEKMFLSLAAEHELEKIYKNGELLLEPLCTLASSEELSPLLFEVLSRALLPFDKTLTSERAEAIKSLILSSSAGKAVELGDGIVFSLGRNSAKFERQIAEEEPVSFDFPLNPGKNFLPDGTEITLIYGDCSNINNLSKQIFLNSDKICGSLHVRSRLPGDKYKAGGMTRNIKKFLIDKKTDKKIRGKLPVFADDLGIVWFPGLPPADRTKASQKDSHITIHIDWSDHKKNEK